MVLRTLRLISIVAWMLRSGSLFAYGDPTPFGTVLLVPVDDCVRPRLRLLQHFWPAFVEKKYAWWRQRAGDVPDDDQWLRLYPSAAL